MNKSLELAICDMQGQLFQLSSNSGYASETFIKTFMTSTVSEDLDKEFHHFQWAGKAYILSYMENEYSDLLIKNKQIYDKEVLYWIGYIYRFWNYYTGENSKKIYKQAPAKLMNSLYLMYHTMSPKMAIDRIKDSYQKKAKK